MRLRDLQSSFKDVLFGGDATAFSEHIRVGGPGDKLRRIEVYRNNVRQSLVRVLQQIFPACCRIMGTRHFLPAARGYILTSDSSGRDLNFYGADFPDFLRQLSETYPQLGKWAFLPELARLEWFYHSVYYAADDTDFDFAAFERAVRDDQDALVLRLSHSVSLLRTKYPLLEIHRQRTESAMDDIAPANRYICVFRKQWRPALEYIDATTYHLMNAIHLTTPFGELVRRFTKVDKILPSLIEKGWVNGER